MHAVVANVAYICAQPCKLTLCALLLLPVPTLPSLPAPTPPPPGRPRGLAKRVIACLDVRANDNGDLVVTKGDQYDVRETGSTGEVRGRGTGDELADGQVGSGRQLLRVHVRRLLQRNSRGACIGAAAAAATAVCMNLPNPTGPPAHFLGQVRNLGKPVELAGRYFEEGADEVTFLNITGGRLAGVGWGRSGGASVHTCMVKWWRSAVPFPQKPTSPGASLFPAPLLPPPTRPGFRDFPLGDLPMLEVLRQVGRQQGAVWGWVGACRTWRSAEWHR